jgi:hypothetical protein
LTVEVFQPAVVPLAFVLFEPSKVSGLSLIASWLYRPTSKFAASVASSAHQPISVTVTAPKGAMNFPPVARLSTARSPAEEVGSAVGAVVTKPAFVPSVSAIILSLYFSLILLTIL